MKNRSVLKFFLIYFGFTIVSNFVHSITPAFLQMIQAPSYINGVAFSVMSLCPFFASPFWGKMGDRKPYPQLMAVGFFGYALGQFFFSIARGVPMLLFARVISGLLNGALAVNALSYLISVSDSENRGQYLAMFAMLQSVGTCIGYLIGGVIGDYSLAVNALSYLISVSDSENRGQYLAMFAMLQSVGTCIGYLIGGVIGDYSLMAVFYAQIGAASVLGIVTLLVLRDAPGRTLSTEKIDFIGAASVLGIVTLLVLRDAPGRTLSTEKIDFAKINPVTSMTTSMRRVDAAMGVYLAIVFCFGFAMMSYDNYFGYFLRDQFGFPTSYNGYFKALIGIIAIIANSTINMWGFAMMSYDNYFGYFLRDQFGFPTSYNGYFKALIGIIAIIANSTINMWINKHTDVRKSITVILGLCSVSITAMLLASHSIPAFLGVALLYYTCNAITMPILQVMMMKDEDKSETGTISGLFNAFISLGRTFGPLIAAFAYGLNPLYPFVLAAAMYMIAALLSIRNRIQYKNRKPRTAAQ